MTAIPRSETTSAKPDSAPSPRREAATAPTERDCPRALSEAELKLVGGGHTHGKTNW
jgi:hypothetical protein